MSKESKISNIKSQIEKNEKKIEKLKFINYNLTKQILNLQETKIPSSPTREERLEQSLKDKLEFSNSFTDFIQKLKEESDRIRY